MPKLKELIGNQIIIRSESLFTEKATLAKLIEVEDFGIWVEYQPFIESILSMAKASHSPKTPVIFVPYAQIAWILGTEDYPALSEESFGINKK